MPGHDSHRRPTIAVVIPCFNEEKTVGRVVEDFLRVLPDCIVVIADNNSTDDTARAARAAGAIVITERRRGKGMAVRKLLADVDAECFVMVDGDATYDAASAIEMTRLVLEESYDMVIGVRKTPEDGGEEYRSGHRFGNAILTWIFKSLFGLPISDTLSGYRAMSRRFAKTFPGSPEGFEVEAELNVHAAVMEAPVAEVPTTYIARPIGSSSKLRTYRDGWRILRRNIYLFRDARPFMSFSLLGLPWLIATVILVIPPTLEYLRTGLVPRFPSLIAGVGCFLVALLLVMCGVILARVSRSRAEMVRLHYLRFAPPAMMGERS